MAEGRIDLQEQQTAQAALYNSEAVIFDDISAHEDPAGRLRSFLLEQFDFAGKTVLEAGAGTGRITDYYVDRAESIVVTDIYDSMLSILRQKYAGLNKISVELCDHRQLRSRFPETYDIFISAFSFNYAFGPDVLDYDQYLEKILPQAKQHIIIEGFGLYEKYDLLSPQSIKYLQTLEKRFQKKEVLSEFVFSSPEQAVAAAKALFPPVAERVKLENKPVIPEQLYVFYD